MKKYDYSNLLKQIDEINLDKIRLSNQIEMNKKNKLVELEYQLLNSGLLEDWRGLCRALSELNLRTNPYPDGNKIPGIAKFDDGNRFHRCMSSGGHWSDYFGISINSTNEIKYVIMHTTTTHFWSGFDSKWAGAMGDEISTKISLIEDFMEAYSVYREIMLQKIYNKMGEKEEENRELRQAI